MMIMLCVVTLYVPVPCPTLGLFYFVNIMPKYYVKKIVLKIVVLKNQNPEGECADEQAEKSTNAKREDERACFAFALHREAVYNHVCFEHSLLPVYVLCWLD